MPDFQALLEATAARERLWAIPGVLRIGFGLKEKAGEVLPHHVLRVYVAEKKPLDTVAPDERVPPEVDGIPIDIVVLAARVDQCSSSLKPGMQITREVYNDWEQSGSIGCFVQKDGHFYILTNQHVFVPNVGGDVRDDVYQPSRSTVAGVACNKPVAHVVGESSPFALKEDRPIGGRTYHVDCGLLELKPGTSFVNDVPGVGTIATAIRDLSTEPLTAGPAGSRPGVQVPAATVSVQKRGARTELTRGTVVELCHETLVGGGPGEPPPQTVVRWEMQARPTSGKSYDETFEISPAESRTSDQIVSMFAGDPITATVVQAASPRRIRFQGLLFSEEGDSGSVWLDDTRKVVGLHFAGNGRTIKIRSRGQDVDFDVPTGRGVAVHVSAVFSALGLSPGAAIVSGTHNTAGEAVRVPGDLVGEPPVPPARVAEIEAAFDRSPLGRELIAAVRGHQAEVRTLIHHRRRVTVAWQRHKGPAFVAAVMNAVREGSPAIPSEVAGYRLVDLVRALRSVLQQEGSPALRAAVEHEGAILVELAARCATLDEVLARLEREPADAIA